MVVEKMKIQWEDDDTSLTENEEMSVFDEQPQVEEDFAELLASSEAGETDSPETSWRVGDKIQAKIAYANPDSPDVLLECGLKDSAVMPRDELLTEAGEFPYEPGDLIEAYVVTAKEGELVLSRNRSQAASGAQAIETAYASKMPVRGKVLKVNKGGFEVRVLSKSAFCPISQMDLSFVKDPALCGAGSGVFDSAVSSAQYRAVACSPAASQGDRSGAGSARAHPKRARCRG